MKIISHGADNDGKVSAYLVAKKFGITDMKDIIMTDYGKGSGFLNKIEKDEKVVICDFSFDNGPYDMKKLLEITKDVIWIDHHISAIEKYGEFGKSIPGVRADGTAACMLTYYYFYVVDKFYSPEEKDDMMNKVFNSKKEDELKGLYKEAPELVRYVHDNDVWRYEFGNDTEYFKLGLESESIKTPIDKRYDELFESEEAVKEVIERGKIIKTYRDSLGAYAVNGGAFEFELCGKKGLCMNLLFGGSQWFGNKMKEYDFVCSFNMNKEGKWEYSFYSDAEKGANCYKLTQFIEPKGGGHEHAAGCVTDKFIFGK